MSKNKKCVYNEPFAAEYLYEIYNFTDNSLTRYRTPVSVLGETTKSYLIKIKEPIRNHMRGDVFWVLKKKIRFPRDFSQNQYWYNNF